MPDTEEEWKPESTDEKDLVAPAFSVEQPGDDTVTPVESE